MAVSSSTTTINVPRQLLSPPKLPKNRTVYATSLIHTLTLSTKPLRNNKWKFIVRSSDDLSSSETGSGGVAEEVLEGESESSIEEPKAPRSLISALNVERALRGIPITDVDYYGILGIRRGCSYDQVTVAYRSKVDELLDTGLDEEDLRKEMEVLKEAYTILSSEDERRMYDWSLARSDMPDRYKWPYEVDVTRPNTDTPPAQEPEDVGPTRLVGYFILGWIVISFALSIALNR